MHRYIASVIQTDTDIEAKGTLDVTVGTEDCDDRKQKKDYCNGPLVAGSKYRLDWFSCHGKTLSPSRDGSMFLSNYRSK